MKRVLVVQPSMQPPGGGNGVAAWMVQALVPHHHVTILSWQRVDVGPINRFFGTHLSAADFDVVTVPTLWRVSARALPAPGTLLRLSLLMRRTRAVSARFDVVMSAQNEIDFGRRGIQYVHYPTYLRPRPAVDLRWYHTPAGLAAYYRIADAIAGFSVDRMKQNLTLVNSDWTGTQVERFLGIRTRTLYPPIIDPEPSPPWPRRRNAFLAVGRISPEKEYERVMDILARVRGHHPDVTLTIVGTWDRHVQGYMRQLRSKASALGTWIVFKENVTRDELRHLMATHRYGIHGMREEHFGMAPAEMARAGCIVWVPRGGGQMEVVGREPALMYDSDGEGVSHILRTMNDAAEQERLRDHLARTSDRFSTAYFMRQVQEIVDQFT
jgi:glycosyltransferase involved in cell wall biosynthesis